MIRISTGMYLPWNLRVTQKSGQSLEYLPLRMPFRCVWSLPRVLALSLCAYVLAANRLCLLLVRLLVLLSFQMSSRVVI